MKTKISLGFMIILMMFPQFVETIYSPALPYLADAFKVSDTKALLTISIYFIAFAIGVIFWGILSDYIGRRKAMIYGLCTYASASIIALISTNFEILLLARFISAFGIAVGSVITQTMMRDIYTGKELGKAFSIMGVALSISPVIGLLLGGGTVRYFGYYGIFILLAILALILVMRAITKLPETKQDDTKITIKSTIALGKKMYTDKTIIVFALLVMCFNVLLFSYYSFAPFIFKKAGLSSTIYGYSGIILAIGSFIGSYINKKCIEKNISPYSMIVSAAVLAFLNATLLYFLNDSLLFLIPMLLIVASFGIAIPNILSQSLLAYKTSIGSAGALFGLLYYQLIGSGLFISSKMHNLGNVVLFFSFLSLILAIIIKRINK